MREVKGRGVQSNYLKYLYKYIILLVGIKIAELTYLIMKINQQFQQDNYLEAI